MTGLAVLCAAAACWALTLPTPAAVRLRAALTVRMWPWHHRIAARAGAALREVSGRRRRVRRWRAAVIELCDGVAAELTAGRAPAAAFAEAAAVLDPPVAGALLRPRPGEELPETLERIAAAPGAEGTAAARRMLADRGGTGWRPRRRDRQPGGDPARSGGASAGDRRAARRAARDGSAAGRAAAARLGMAAALGARPLAFLFGTVEGGICLVLGAGLDALGLWWTGRLAAAAEVPR